MKKLNKKILFIISCVFVIFLILSAIFTLNWIDNKNKQDLKKSDYSIVRIEGVVLNNQKAIGSGCIVKWDENSKTAWIATANHVMSDQDFSHTVKEIRIFDKDNKQLSTDIQKDKIYTKDFEYVKNEHKDVGIVKVKLNISNPYVFELADENDGEKVDVKGYAQLKGHKNTDTKLHIIHGVKTSTDKEISEFSVLMGNKKKYYFDQNSFFSTYSMGKGNSGGPALNKDNKIIGLAISANSLSLGNKVDGYETYDSDFTHSKEIKTLLEQIK